RDFHVTGVQTCALPILFTALTERGEQPESDDPSTAYTAYAEACRRRQAQATAAARAETLRAQLDTWRRHHDAEARRAREREEARSEERRGGKAGRARRA